MEIHFTIVCTILLYVAFHVIDGILRSCHCLPYTSSLDSLGVTVRPLTLRWSSPSLAGPLRRCGAGRGTSLRLWFSLGVATSLVLLPLSVALLMQTLYRLLNPPPPGEGGGTPMLETVVPGVNLPAAELPSYFLSLLLCSGFHEFGHGVAAAREQVRVLGGGILLVVLLPAAFVELSSEALLSLPVWPRLRILCAGVWHNVALCVVAALLLVAAPTIWRPLYSTGDGVIVYDVPEGSPLGGAAGLVVGDVITAVDDCLVTSRRDWVSCLTQTAATPGLCVPDDDVAALDETVMHAYQRDDFIECCPETSASTHLCFNFREDPSDPERAMAPHSCLPARALLAPKPPRCVTTADCALPRLCLFPSVTNSSLLLSIHRRGNSKPVLFVGAAAAAFNGVSVSQFIPRFSPLPAWLPQHLLTLCRHLLSLSAALAVLNLVPCHGLDGAWVCETLWEAVLGRGRRAGAWAAASTAAGTALLAVTVVLSLKQALL